VLFVAVAVREGQQIRTASFGFQLIHILVLVVNLIVVEHNLLANSDVFFFRIRYSFSRKGGLVELYIDESVIVRIILPVRALKHVLIVHIKHF
jgi:hypothetical protein